MKKLLFSKGKHWCLHWLHLSLSVLLFLCMAAKPIYANEKLLEHSLSFSKENKKVEDILDRYSKASNVSIVYKADLFRGAPKIEIEESSLSIEQFLEKYLVPRGFNYKIDGETVVIKRKLENPIKKDLSREVLKKTINKSEVPQKQKVKGKVTDADGEPLPGVAIQVNGSTQGVISGMDGTYAIEVIPTDKLTFSFLGMTTQTIDIKNRSTLNVTLKSDSEELEEYTVVAFGKQKKESVIGSIETVSPEELKVPSSNLTQALAGRLSGVISYQRSGEPGEDNAEFFIRGVTTFGYSQSPLILLDGFEISSSDLAKIQPDDISSFSIMKDATATAVYGARGANGIILVTTKEGHAGKTKISFRHETSISRPTRIPEVVDGVRYMNLYNEALENDNPLLPAEYSAQQIENTINNVNPNVYPNVNWYDALFADQTINRRYNLNIRGGGKVVKFYLAATYNQDNGILEVDKKNDFNTNIKIDKYNLRANLDIKLSKTTNISAKFNSDFQRKNSPLVSGENVFNSVMSVNPVEFPMYFQPDEANVFTRHILFGNTGKADMSNPYADMVKGYVDSFSSSILTQFSLSQDLSFITEGLNFRAGMTIQSYGAFSQSRSYSPYYYTIGKYDEITDIYELQKIKDGTEALGNPSVSKNANSRNYFEARLMYNREFGKHGISMLAVGMAEEKMNQGSNTDVYSTLPSRNNGISGRFTYCYDSKYNLEANFGYNGSEKFSEVERYGFFPSFGLGYMVSNENFYGGWVKRIIPTMKLKYTYGVVGNDAIAGADKRFFFLSDIDVGPNGYNWGTNFNTGYGGFSVNRYANPLITWEKAYKTNLGIELNISNFMDIQCDYFSEVRTDIYLERNFIPASVGMSANIWGNVGENKSSGIDGSIDLNHSFNKNFWVSGRFNFTYATNEIVQNEEQYKYDYQDRRGEPINRMYGYIAERLFVDQGEIENSPEQTFGNYQPGDIKYKDINKDGAINEYDKVPIGYPSSPEINYGFGVSVGIKGLDLSCFFQGSARSSFMINANKIAPFINKKNALSLVADNYWNKNNPDPNSFWPRLSAGYVNNNSQSSTWWLREGSFLRVKNVEVGYSLPKHWVNSVRLDQFRVYFSGSNLHTFSSFDLWDVEMGGNGLGYPLQRVYNVGAQISF